MDIRKYFDVIPNNNKKEQPYLESQPVITYLDEKSWIIQGQIPIDIINSYDFDRLWQLHPEEYGQIKMFNKLIDTPR